MAPRAQALQAKPRFPKPPLNTPELAPQARCDFNMPAQTASRKKAACCLSSPGAPPVGVPPLVPASGHKRSSNAAARARAEAAA
eukprot:CAMPEP_0179030126 /NCGR_PEP_ID=MMETSP0796-20121207/10408_1 /TAXON_ID=73915 /ORGANISM="Pyrodinium bahamense, Strain pbaha01" /LENGTH=83 /DNA_ID=CAMNT_0020726305 /DNA_START=101 /DNA_END=349 /DNA_ORIENTATION=+